jgi:hypothetical protein
MIVPDPENIEITLGIKGRNWIKKYKSGKITIAQNLRLPHLGE